MIVYQFHTKRFRYSVYKNQEQTALVSNISTLITVLAVSQNLEYRIGYEKSVHNKFSSRLTFLHILFDSICLKSKLQSFGSARS